MYGKKLISLVLAAIGAVLCLLLLPLELWFALIGTVLIILAVIIYRSC